MRHAAAALRYSATQNIMEHQYRSTQSQTAATAALLLLLLLLISS
jgi:hypothetical protein